MLSLFFSIRQAGCTVNLFKSSWRVFWRNPITMVAAIALFVVCNGIGIYLALQFDYVLVFTSCLLRCQLIWFIGFGILGQIFIGGAKDKRLWEALGVIPGGRGKQLFSQGLVLGAISLILFVNLFLYACVIMAKQGDGSVVVFFHFFKVYLLDVWLLSMMGMALGGAIAVAFGRGIVSYGVLIGAFLLFSPLFQQFLVQIGYQNSVVQYGSVLDLFPYRAGSSFVIDNFYGYPNEAVRWNRILFWVFFFIAVLCWLLKGKRKTGWVVTALCTVVAVGQLAGFFLGGSQHYWGYDSSKDIWLADQDYFQRRLDKKRPGNVSIVGYDMELSAKRELKAAVTVELADVQETELPFTLYHGYRLHAIKDNRGEEVPFERDGDYVLVSVAAADPSALTFLYEGNGAGYYSNSQGILLLANFPYYPMAGYLPMAQFQKRADGLGDTSFLTTEKEFQVDIESDVHSLFCNLPGENGHYEGRAEGLTLVGGLGKAVRLGETEIYMPLMNEDESQSWMNAEEAFRLSEEEREQLCQKIGLPAEQLRSPKMIVGGGNLPVSSFLQLSDHTYTLLNIRGLNLLRLQSNLPNYIPQESYSALEVLQGKADDSMIREKREVLEAFLSFSLYGKRAVVETLGRESDGIAYQIGRSILKDGEAAVLQKLYPYLMDEEDMRPLQEVLEVQG